MRWKHNPTHDWNSDKCILEWSTDTSEPFSNHLEAVWVFLRLWYCFFGTLKLGERQKRKRFSNQVDTITRCSCLHQKLRSLIYSSHNFKREDNSSTPIVQIWLFSRWPGYWYSTTTDAIVFGSDLDKLSSPNSTKPAVKINWNIRILKTFKHCLSLELFMVYDQKEMNYFQNRQSLQNFCILPQTSVLEKDFSPKISGFFGNSSQFF